MINFLKRHLVFAVVMVLLLPALCYGIGNRQNWFAQIVGFNTPGVASVLAAVTDTGSQQVVTTGILPINIPGRITATSGGTAADIKAIQVIITGTDPNDTVITETLPAFTVNTATTVTGVKVFKSVTSITIPAHDGTGATTSVGVGGSPAVADIDGVMSALTDTGSQQVITTGTSINHLDVPRNITATSGGTAADIKAIQVIIAGTNYDGATITETLPAFTVNSATTVSGSKAFREVTSITVPAHDGTGATTSVGFGDVLGVEQRLSRNTLRNSYLNNVLEGTSATFLFDETDLESNTVDLNSALNSTQVIIEYMETP